MKEGGFGLDTVVVGRGKQMQRNLPRYITLGPMLLFRSRTIWKTVDGNFYPDRLIA